MDIEKLVNMLKQHGVSCVRSYGRYCSVCDDAATALSTLQAENERLKSLLGESGQDLWSKENQRADRLEAENEKLRDELEQVRQERYVAVECINTVYSYILIKSKTDAVRTIEKWLRGHKED